MYKLERLSGGGGGWSDGSEPPCPHSAASNRPDLTWTGTDTGCRDGEDLRGVHESWTAHLTKWLGPPGVAVEPSARTEAPSAVEHVHVSELPCTDHPEVCFTAKLNC